MKRLMWLGMFFGALTFADEGPRLVLRARTKPWVSHERAMGVRIWKQERAGLASYRLEYQRTGEKVRGRAVPEAVYLHLRDSLMALALVREARKADRCPAALVAELPEVGQTAEVCAGDSKSYVAGRALLGQWLTP